MRKLVYILPVFLFALIFAGCEQNNQIQPGNNEDGGFVTCTMEEKTAENCNMVYQPVCGDDGQTYGNSCEACSSHNIHSYKVGKCDYDEGDGSCLLSDEGINECLDVFEEEVFEITVDVPEPNF